MSTSSARPDDLDGFARGGRAGDRNLHAGADKLSTAYKAFVDGCGWGRLDAGSLLNALNPQLLRFNEDDAHWVETIAAAFRRAGGEGAISSLPDAAIAASLQRAGLSDVRGSVTFDDPIAFGFPPTSGYADDPVNTATGNFVALESDLPFGGPLEGLRLARTYNSRSDRVGPFGRGWASWATARLRPRQDGAEYEGPDGQRALFSRLGAGYGRVPGVGALVEPLESGLALAWFGGERWEFDDAGLPARIQRGPGTEVRLRHDERDGSSSWPIEAARASIWRGRASASSPRPAPTAAHARPDGTRARCEYDLCGRRVLIEDPTGAITRIEYSPGGKVMREISPSGRVHAYEYDRCGRLAAQIDGGGRRSAYRYDADGALVERVEPDGEVTGFRYDEGGRVVESSQPGAGVTRYEYDLVGRTTAITDRAAGTRAFEYDAAGRLVAATDANDAVTRYAYDERDWLTEVVDPLGATTTRRYDPVGRLVAQTDPLGRTTTLAYDGAGRIVERVDGSSRTTRWTYDASGRVSSLGAAGREPITIKRDALGRLTSIEEPGSFVNELRWDRAGRLVERRRDGMAMRWRYTPDGERAAVGHPDGSETTFDYDGGGMLIATRHPGIGAIELARDPAGRLVGAAADGMRARWRYEHGDLAEYRLEAAGRTSTAQLTRDGVGRVVEAIVDGNAQRFSYDAAGQLLAAGIRRGAFSFCYDANGRLERERSPVATLDYEYDAAGQLLTRRREGASAATEYEYDGAGRRIRESDADLGRTWRWDDLGRLVRVQTAVGGGEDPRTTSLRVDALGELAEVDGTGFMWDTPSALAPLAWMGEQAVVGHGSPWALAGNGAVEWLVADWQGTVGDVERDPWGAALDSSGPGVVRLGYRGELELDGQAWLRNRVYEPATRSFLDTDPRPPVPGTACAANPYHYAANNPAGLSDPFGLRPISDAELQKHRDRMNHNIFQKTGDLIADHPYIFAGVMIVGGIAVMATGVGGPLGAAMIGGAMISAGGSAGMQQFTTGQVSWGEVLVAGAVGGAAGGLGYGAGALVSGTSKAAAVGRGALAGGVESAAGGAANRGLHGQDPFDPGGLTTDLLTGGVTGGLGGRLGGTPRAPEVLPKPLVEHPKLANIVDDLYKGTENPTRIGTGTTADAIRNEIATGQPTAGRFHLRKGLIYERALSNFLRRNPDASDHDRLVAQSLLDELRSARGSP